MALSDKSILEEMEKGDIAIHPFNEQNLATSSYDVTLGEYYFSEKKSSETLYNMYDRAHVSRIWGTEANIAKTMKETIQEINAPLTNIREDDRIIVLEQGETILAHTNEFIGGRNHITTMMKARSSTGRNFIEVCKCAGWGDVGYTNRWTMEITNNSRYHRIPLVVGRRIAQIIFFETGPIRENDYTTTGKYQATDDTERLKREWDPTSMLPKMYHDRDIKH